MLVRAESKFQSLPELIAAAKAAPETVTFASAGAGSTHHLTIELIANRSGMKFLHVPYQGDAAAINALLGDQVQFSLATPTQAISNVQAGKMRALAVTGNTRMPALPNVPTVQEATRPCRLRRAHLVRPGGPGGIPRAIVERLNAEVRKRRGGARGACAPGADRRRGAAQHAGGIPRPHRARAGDVDQDRGRSQASASNDL